MPFLLIIAGLVLTITSIQNTYAALGAQLNKDFFGAQGFLIWMLAIIATGALGYVQGWEKFSRWFLALILISIVLAQSKNTGGNLFTNLLQQVKNPKAPAAPATAAGAVAPAPAPGSVVNGQIIPRSLLSDFYNGMAGFGSVLSGIPNK